MSEQEARTEFAKAITSMRAAGVSEQKIDDCKFAFEFTINQTFRTVVADLCAAVSKS